MVVKTISALFYRLIYKWFGMDNGHIGLPTFTIDNPVVMSNLQEVLTENGYMTNSIHTVKEHHQIYKGPLLSPGDDGDDGDVHPQDRKPRYDN